MADSPKKTERQKFEDDSDFRRVYANNVKFENMATDCTLNFGITRPDEPTLRHTAVTLSWPYAKLLIFYLAANVAIHEAEMGTKIQIPTKLLPNPPSEDPQGLTPTNLAAVERVYDDFLKSL